MAIVCCEYKVARRALVVTNILVILFSFLYVGVGVSCLLYASHFQETIEGYCIQKCAQNALVNQNKQDHLVLLDPVGCTCDTEPGHTTLPTVVFITPAIGLIVIGIFTLVAAFLGCAGSIRERPVLIYIYCCFLFFIIILQFSFGGAAGAVASGSAPDIQEPLTGVLRDNYKKFDWENLRVFFPPECYAGKSEEKDGNSTIVYQYPLCNFDTCYHTEDLGVPTDEEKACCDADYLCDSSKPNCITGARCLEMFFNKAAGPVATMCFLPIFLEILCIIFACLIRKGASAQASNADKAQV